MKCARGPARQNLTHRSGHRHPTPVVAKPSRHAISEIKQMRVVIGSGGDVTTPLKLPTHLRQLRKELD